MTIWFCLSSKYLMELYQKRRNLPRQSGFVLLFNYLLFNYLMVLFYLII